MDPEIQALIERIDELGVEELRDLEQRIMDAAEAALDDGSNEQAEELLPALDQVRAAITAQEQTAAEREQRAAELRERIRPAATEGEGQGEGDGSGEEAEEGEGEQVETTDAGEGDGEQTEEEAEAIAAAASTATQTANPARPRIERMALRRPPARAPRPKPDSSMPALVASGDVPGISAGQRFASPEAMGQAFADKASSVVGGRAREGSKYHVGSVVVDYPAERQLGNDALANMQRIESVVGPAALVAAGGLCAPLEASYDLTVVATADRPVRDALARFQATRGGVRWITPPTLADLDAGVDIWTADNDATPGSDGPATKPCVTITCGDEQEAVLRAIALCITTGNFARRTFPEQFRAWYQLGLAAHSRLAEGALLDDMALASTTVTDGQNLGVARDILNTLGRAASAYRNRHRMSSRATLLAFLPAWSRDAIREDLARELPGAYAERLATAEADIDRFFAVRNIDVTWYIDTETGAGQVSPSQGDNLPLNEWIDTVVWYLSHPGAFLFLDGGTLDLGIEIRDSSLNALNNVQAFMETFEGLAYTGVEALRGSQTICVSGHTSGTVDLDCLTGS